MKFPLVVVFASVLVAAGCTGSESVDPGTGGKTGNSGSGGATGSGSGGTGSGGTIGGGSGGKTGSGSGGTIGGGSGGTAGGSGGARLDGGADTSPTDGGVDGDGTLTFTVDIAYELRQACGGCHLSQLTQGNFNMNILDDFVPGPNAYPSVTGTVTADHAGCVALDATKKRIVPFKPANSLLFIKISVASPPSGCGKHMPDGANMSPQQIAKIKTWIMQGAKL
jgi:hypothetical protein